MNVRPDLRDCLEWDLGIEIQTSRDDAQLVRSTLIKRVGRGEIAGRHRDGTSSYRYKKLGEGELDHLNLIFDNACRMISVSAGLELKFPNKDHDNEKIN